MSRDWLAVYAAVLGKPKYRRLSPSAKGALVHVWLLASTTSPEATWATTDDLLEILELDGFSSAELDELIGRGWIDVEPDHVVVHDWDDHQLAASKGIRDAFEAERKRQWRRQKSSSPAPLSPTETSTRTPTGQDKSPETSGLRPDAVRTPERTMASLKVGDVGEAEHLRDLERLAAIQRGQAERKAVTA